MGRNVTGLAGMMVVGPKNIPALGELRDRAIEQVGKIQDFFRRYTEEGEDGLDMETLGYLSEEERAGLYSVSILVPEDEPAVVVDEFLSFWREGSPDCVSRLLPDDPERMIVFAACEESLLEGDGFGYSQLERAKLCGLFPVFGIC